MTTPQPRPALGSEFSMTQVTVPIPGDGSVSRKHRIILVENLTRNIKNKALLLPGNTLSSTRHIAPPGCVWLYWGSDYDENGDQIPNPLTVIDRGHYLPYPPADGVPINSSLDPVNQHVIGPKWKDILSRFAHDVMAFNPQLEPPSRCWHSHDWTPAAPTTLLRF